MGIRKPSKVTLKPYFGFVIRSGFAEDSSIGHLFIRHMDGGYDTLKEALTDLSHYLFDACFADWDEDGTMVHTIPGSNVLHHYAGYLRGLAGYICDGFDSFHAYGHGEEWHVWDNITDLYPHLDKFWELKTERLHDVLPLYLDAGRLKDIELGDEIIKFQEPPSDAWNKSRQDKAKSSKAWNRVAPLKKNKK